MFWTISSVQLFLLAGTLPRDQDKMEAELAMYAASALRKHREQQHDQTSQFEENKVVIDSDQLHEELKWQQ